MMTALSARIGLHPSTHTCHSRALVRVHVCDNCATNGAASESNGRARAGGRAGAGGRAHLRLDLHLHAAGG